MILFPHAKINLGLQVVEKRQDGFHNIISCLYPIGWCDVLEIIEKPEFSFRSTGLDIPGTGQENLCTRAYQLIKEEFDIPPVYIHLHKIIPIGAGLGGGSSDAAFTLKGLNQLFGLSIPNQELKRLAAELGSDCAFFIDGNPTLATGTGDQFQPIQINMPKGYLVVVTPPVHVDTGMAYQRLNPKPSDIDLKKSLGLSPDQWQSRIINDFEVPVSDHEPAIARVKGTLMSKGALFTSLSGSGSSVYGIFKDEKPWRSWFETTYRVWEQKIGSDHQSYQL